MKFLNPFIEIHDGLNIRWSELQKDKTKYLEHVWNKGDGVICTCKGVDEKIQLGVGKKNGEYYLFNKGDVGHKEQCPAGNIGKRGEYFDEHLLSDMQSMLEKTILKLGINYWNTKFSTKRTKSWLRYKFMSEFDGGLLFYPEFGEDNVNKNNKELGSMVELGGGEFYVGGFIYNIEESKNGHGSHIKLKGYDKKLFVSEDVAAIIRKGTKKFDYFCLIKFIVKNNGFFIGVDASGIYIDKSTLTPHYWIKEDVDKDRNFSCYLCALEGNRKVVTVVDD